MPSQLTVRRAEPSDAEAIARGNRAMARETEQKELDGRAVGRGVRAVLDDPAKGFYLVAERDGEGLVGQLMVTFEWSDWRDARFWWVQSVYVAPEARRSGVFRALWEHLIEEARRAGDVCGVRLYVDQDNATARDTYAALGMSASRYRMYELDL